MLISPDRRIVVSNLGWVDKSALWTYEAAKDRAASISLGDAKYLSLFPCQDPHQFVVLHHYDGASIRLSLHSFEDPGAPLCEVVLSGSASSVKGDLAAFAGAPRYYVAYFDSGSDQDYQLLHLDIDRGEIGAEPFPWYDRSYDKGYQGLVSLIGLPSGHLIVSVQRDSHPVVYDPAAKQVVKKLSLADRMGNPTLRLAARRKEIWADDYDTLLKLDLDSLKAKRARRLQDSASGTAQFIGRWCFNDDESLCFVARPYSGDMVAISMDDMKTRYVAKLGKQPLEAVALDNERVIARDWMTGQLLKGVLL